MITLNEFVAFVSMEMVHYFCLFMFLPCVWMFCYIAVDSIIVLPCHWFGNLCIGVRTTSSIKVSFVCCLLLPSLADLGGMEECFPNGWSFVQAHNFNNATTLFENRVLFREHFYVRNSKAGVVGKGFLTWHFISVDFPSGLMPVIAQTLSRERCLLMESALAWICPGLQSSNYSALTYIGSLIKI